MKRSLSRDTRHYLFCNSYSERTLIGVSKCLDFCCEHSYSSCNWPTFFIYFFMWQHWLQAKLNIVVKWRQTDLQCWLSIIFSFCSILSIERIQISIKISFLNDCNYHRNIYLKNLNFSATIDSNILISLYIKAHGFSYISACLVTSLDRN